MTDAARIRELERRLAVFEAAKKKLEREVKELKRQAEEQADDTHKIKERLNL